MYTCTSGKYARRKSQLVLTFNDIFSLADLHNLSTFIPFPNASMVTMANSATSTSTCLATFMSLYTDNQKTADPCRWSLVSKFKLPSFGTISSPVCLVTTLN